MSGYKVKIWVFVVLTVSFLTYSFILYSSEIKEPVQANALAQKGKILWQQKNCTACHQLYGLGGHLGPDLTNIYSKRNEAYIRAFLKVGSPVMPDFKLTNDEMNALVEFLKYTNQTGISDPKSFKQHINGTITQ